MENLPGITEQLAQFAVTLEENAVPDEVSERALALVVDLAGSAIRAAGEADSSASIRRMIERLGFGEDGPCSVFGLNRGHGPVAAALLNGAFGHSLDFDDTHADSSLHPSAPVVPAALAAAQLMGASGAAFLCAVVVGYEVCCRLGNALDPTAHYARGFHPTATAGTFGACVAAGRLLGLDSSKMVSAMGVAASQASGSLQFLQNGAWNKRYQVGEASMKGLAAAMLAAEGFKGAVAAIEGKHGFLVGYSDSADPSRAIAGLREVWETMRIGVKPYPACRYTHAALDGLIMLMNREQLDAEAIERVNIGLHRNGITLVGDPLAAKRRARDIVAGQFSMPFVAAVALSRKRFGWDDYNLLGEAAIDALCDRINVVRDLSLENAPHPFGATIELVARGESHRLRIADPSGEPETFPGSDAMEVKFLTLTRPVLGSGAALFLQRLRDLPHVARLDRCSFGPIAP